MSRRCCRRRLRVYAFCRPPLDVETAPGASLSKTYSPDARRPWCRGLCRGLRRGHFWISSWSGYVCEHLGSRHGRHVTDIEWSQFQVQVSDMHQAVQAIAKQINNQVTSDNAR